MYSFYCWDNENIKLKWSKIKSLFPKMLVQKDDDHQIISFFIFCVLLSPKYWHWTPINCTHWICWPSNRIYWTRNWHRFACAVAVLPIFCTDFFSLSTFWMAWENIYTIKCMNWFANLFTNLKQQQKTHTFPLWCDLIGRAS